MTKNTIPQRNKKNVEIPLSTALGQQLELFASTNKINLTELYAKIPKGVHLARKDNIVWETENLAQPATFPFLGPEKQQLFSTIKPAFIEDPKNKGVFKSVFPCLREDRVEWAIVQLMTKLDLHVEYENDKIAKTYIIVTPYQIRKEIVEAINEREGRNLKVNDCQYSTKDVIEALEVLKGTTVTVTNPEGEKRYHFNRIKDLYVDGNKKQVVELNSMITGSINSNDYLTLDRALIAPNTEIESALVHYFHLHWRNIKRGQPVKMYATNLMGAVDYPVNEKRSISMNISTFIEILKKLPEVENVIVDEDKTKKDGRKVINRLLEIYMSEYFIQKSIFSNEVGKRTRSHLKTPAGLIIKPLREEFGTESEYQLALKNYYTEI